MPLRLRFLLDTNILIPLQDSSLALEPSLANFVRLAGIGGHHLLYHPASEADIRRDNNAARRASTLARLRQYTVLQAGPPCPWNTATTSVNDACDNEILFALHNDAAHALVTEDQKLHAKAKIKGLEKRVFFIQSAENWLQRLHQPSQVQLPHIDDVELHTLTGQLDGPFFDSLRAGYSGFNGWFRRKAQEGRSAWIYRQEGSDELSALCIYAIQNNEPITDAGLVLPGDALKLCTFKVGEQVRGRKIGELFLRASFRSATDQRCESIFVHANAQRHVPLINLLEDFGFSSVGTYQGDEVYVKQHPLEPPPIEIDPFEYVKRFYPHYMSGTNIQKYLVPIQPQFHDILFPDYRQPGAALPANHPLTDVGNAMKLAYLCHSPTNSVRPGDIVLFYRTQDLKAVTTLGVVESYDVYDSAVEIARRVSRRTVYSKREIAAMATKPTKVMLFRLIEHLSNPVSYNSLTHQRIVRGPIQSIRKITDASFSRILRAAER